jgi:hypothetical protein
MNLIDMAHKEYERAMRVIQWDDRNKYHVVCHPDTKKALEAEVKDAYEKGPTQEEGWELTHFYGIPIHETEDIIPGAFLVANPEKLPDKDKIRLGFKTQEQHDKELGEFIGMIKGSYLKMFEEEEDTGPTRIKRKANE